MYLDFTPYTYCILLLYVFCTIKISVTSGKLTYGKSLSLMGKSTMCMLNHQRVSPS